MGLIVVAGGLAGCGSGGPALSTTPGAIGGQAKTRILATADLPSTRQPGAVSVFPSPGTMYDLPGTQISFRGVSPRRIGRIAVVGSVTGRHGGRLRADSDGRGVSFVPRKPFAPGETVHVTTRLPVLGAVHGDFHFRIAHPARPIPPEKLPYVPAASGSFDQFRSRPGLRPAALDVTRNDAPAGLGEIFVASQAGPLQNGPMIVGPRGNLIWFHPLRRRNVLATDFRVQTLHGQPVLTWWQGFQNQGSGRGVGVILNRHYRRIATVRAGNGLAADLHEFIVTPSGEAWLIATSPVDIAGVHRPVIDSVIQEIDIKTGLVLFEWHALDHIGLDESYKYGPWASGHVLDPYHMNSLSFAPGGKLIVSLRNTSAVYEIDRRSGQVIWRLAGKKSSFRLGRGTGLAFQHDAIMQRGDTLSIFDNGAGPPRAQPSSTGLEVRLDEQNASATLVSRFQHSPPVSANFEGSVQMLPGGDAFLGYGQRPDVTEFTARGAIDYDAHFVAKTNSYRAYRFRWAGRPLSPPAVRKVRSGPYATLFMSWNGATGIARWRLLGGERRHELHLLGDAASQGFETQITARVHRYLRVEAVDAAGRVIGRSRLLTSRVAPRRRFGYHRHHRHHRRHHHRRRR